VYSKNTLLNSANRRIGGDWHHEGSAGLFDGPCLAAAATGTSIDGVTALTQGFDFKARIKPRNARLTGAGFLTRRTDLGVASTNASSCIQF